MRAAEWRAEPWRNGGGTPHELAAHVDAAGTLLWRVSVADIARDGPFSLFPGYERQTALLAGRGFHLGYASVSAAHPIVEYSGDVASECVLTDGPVRVLNAFAARGRVSARLLFQGEAVVTGTGTGVAVCVEGIVNVGDETLQVWDSVRFDGPMPVVGSGGVLMVILT